MQLAPLQIGILVNNVGVSYPHAEYYESIEDQLIDDLIAINIQATNKVWPAPCTEHQSHIMCHDQSHQSDVLSQSGRDPLKALRPSIYHISRS